MSKTPRPEAFLGVDRSVWSTVDRAFVGILAGSLFLHCSVVLVANQRPPRPEPADEAVRTERVARFPLPPPDPPKTNAAGDGAKGTRARSGPVARPTHEEMLQGVQSRLRRLVADPVDGRGSGFDDLLQAAHRSNTVDEALENAHHDLNSALTPMSRRNGSGPSAQRIEAPSTEGGGEVSVGEAGVRGRHPGVRPDEGPIDAAGCNAPSIAKIVKRNLRAIAMCYEHELPHHPTLQGKLVVRIEIDAAGKVGDVTIEEDQLHSDAVVSCITRFIRLWVFPPQGRECPVVYPLVFVPQG